MGYFRLSPFRGDRGLGLSSRLVVKEARIPVECSDDEEVEQDLFDGLPQMVSVSREPGNDLVKSVLLKAEGKRKIHIGGSTAKVRRQNPMAAFVVNTLKGKVTNIDLEVCGHFRLSSYNSDRGTSISSRLIVPAARPLANEKESTDEDDKILNFLFVKIWILEREIKKKRLHSKGSPVRIMDVRLPSSSL
ncbi:hypothetical protein BCR41DRAFT_373310 [Lobosporangium transversale]|uniref:Uncharacterized protein n=1 Tax=Lobosporangium transversale TaxID=64571 RepID=A0A1Y2GI99_9FUNG|nr:hypothetical protein BCR41DRAFT_373310 [Lobosporangium transversale]ORZ08277.1 hypothetical protein BCR41DRAFT_373310 [Lobosporangium transversale]|eukprot:XP_021878360.1 hypothetical protein BCR41DRAFT_373310 [Lobosporangium transversale]